MRNEFKMTFSHVKAEKPSFVPALEQAYFFRGKAYDRVLLWSTSIAEA